MTARKAKEKAPPRGEVLRLERALLRDVHAAEYLDRKPSWMRAQRAADVRALREGREPTGPKWLVIGRAVFYRVLDLEAWITAHGVERGVVAFSNRGGNA